jgi:uncharacterized protein (TIGR00369 family)
MTVGGAWYHRRMNANEQRTGPFWDAVAGRIAAPPAAQTLGWRLDDIDPDAGTVRVWFDARPEFTNPVGVIQGGFLAAMLDDTMGPALVATLEPDQFAPTLELKVNFLRSARPGPIVGAARVVHRGGNIAFLAGELSDAEGRVLATATATAKVVRLAGSPEIAEA